MTHKLATWFDQFGTSGCVGCGRCITWCPVGIDITEEVAAIRATEEGACGSIDELIADSPAFAGLGRAPPRADRRLRRRTRSFAAGEPLFREGEPADRFFLIRHGVGRARARRARREPSRSRRSTTARWSAGRGCSSRTAGTSTRRRVDDTARDRLRRRLPARQVRGRPRARLRADAALRGRAGRPPAGHPPAAPRRLWQPLASAEPSRRRWCPAPFRVDRAAAGHARTRGRSSSSRRRRRLEFAARPVHHARTPSACGEVPISISGDPDEPARLVHTVRAVGAATRGDLRRRAGAACSACAGPFGRPWPVDDGRGRRRGGRRRRHRARAAAPGDPRAARARASATGGSSLLYGGAHARAAPLPERAARRGGAGLDVHVTVDAAGRDWRGRVGVVTELIDGAAFDPGSAVAWSAGPR